VVLVVPDCRGNEEAVPCDLKTQPLLAVLLRGFKGPGPAGLAGRVPECEGRS
jgi:hypothetical protein